MNLNDQQCQLVCENLGLVRKVIKDKVHGVNQLGIFTYDDIYQIGCIGLCKAAATDKGGVFSTYAYRLIWHEICDALVYATHRTSRELTTDPELIPWDPRNSSDPLDSMTVLPDILDAAEKSTKGVVAKGICAMRMMADGYTCREIGEQMGTNDKNVAAWISKARKYLKKDPEILQLRNSI